MVSGQDFERFSFFNGMNEDQLSLIAEVSRNLEVESGFLFFAEGDQVDYLYLLQDGKVDICYDVPAEAEWDDTDPVAMMREDDFDVPRNNLVEPTLSSGFLSVCELSPGDVFGWTSLVPPNVTHAGALARTACRILAVDSKRLEMHFARDPQLGYQMAIRTAQTIRDRVRDLRLQAVKLSERTVSLKN